MKIKIILPTSTRHYAGILFTACRRIDLGRKSKRFNLFFSRQKSIDGGIIFIIPHLLEDCQSPLAKVWGTFSSIDFFSNTIFGFILGLFRHINLPIGPTRSAPCFCRRDIKQGDFRRSGVSALSS